MWLSTTPVLTYGLLIVHVSMVSCLNYQFGAPSRTSSYGFGRTATFTPAGSNRGYPTGPTLTSADLVQRFGASVDFDDERPSYQSQGDWSQYNPSRRSTNPSVVEAQSSYSSPVSSYFAPRTTQYGPNRNTGYIPYRYTPEPETKPAFSRFGTFSPYYIQSETQYRQPVPSRVPAPQYGPNRYTGYTPYRFTPEPEAKPAFSRFGTFSPFKQSETQYKQPVPSRVPDPPPRTTSSTSNGMGSSLPANNPSDSPPSLPSKKKRKIFSEIDGRRLDGRQTQEWPQLGGFYRIVDAGNYLEPSVFNGVLIPMSIVNHVRNSLGKSKLLSTENKAAGEGRAHHFSLEIEARAYDDFDVDMLQQAIREVQGNDDDYDNPDPWTYATTYSKEVLDYNRELHNYYRAKHYAGPLEYFDVIHPESHAYAVKMAKYLSDTSVNNLDHNFELLNRNMWSENLYADTSSFDGRAPAMVVKRAVDSFYEEIDLWNNQYNMKHPNVQDPVTGHFTCLVWRSSKRMGMGLAKYRNNASNKTTYVAVFNYDPRGNIQGYYDSNVLEPHAYDDGRPLPKAICPYPSKFVNDTNYD